MARAVDWKIGARRLISESPELYAETIKGVHELMATGGEEDRQVAYAIARGLLELEFDSDADLLSQLAAAVPA